MSAVIWLDKRSHPVENLATKSHTVENLATNQSPFFVYLID